VAGVAGGVECSDGENRGAYYAAVWLCAMLMQTCVVFVCRLAPLRFWSRVGKDTWTSHSGWCRRRGRMQ
jgi:hypothetical protein